MTVSDQSIFIIESADGLLREGGLGAIFAVLTIFAFLLSARSTFVAAVSIPLSILTALVIMQVTGITLNILTLGGLAVAIGELVDDAIVDVENVFRRLKENRAAGSPKNSLLVVYEASSEVRNSIVYATIIVVLVFLQSWRSAIIPLVAVPVAIIGTFAALAICGFSINNLTLFGPVLAVGIVVDDVIVVVEAVEHHIERGLSPRAAALQAMEEVSGPVIAVGWC